MDGAVPPGSTTATLAAHAAARALQQYLNITSSTEGDAPAIAHGSSRPPPASFAPAAASGSAAAVSGLPGVAFSGRADLSTLGHSQDNTRATISSGGDKYNAPGGITGVGADGSNSSGGDGSSSGSSPVLAAAREQLQRLVSVRLKELQLLTGSALVRPRRTDAQLAKLTNDSQQPVWEAIGCRASPFAVDVPPLPPAIRRDLYCQQDILLVLAGLSRELGAISVQTPAAHRTDETCAGGPPPGGGGGRAGSGLAARGPLPRSLGLVDQLPALKELQAPSLEWLRTFFNDLRPQQRHVGVDDRLYAWFADMKQATGRTLVRDGQVALCKTFARHGVPQGIRPAVWEAALGLAPLTTQDTASFCDLCEAGRVQPLLVDLATNDAVVRGVQDSEQFFIFEEVVRAVLLAFSRDGGVAEDCAVPPTPCATAPVSAPDARSSSSAQTARAASPSSGRVVDDVPSQPYPPCGVLPFQGVALYAAPVCYLFDSPAAVYRLFRTMYCRYWCKLHTLSASPLPAPALPMLLRTYEHLLMELDPEVSMHMYRHVGCPAATVAMPWITASFVGYLPVEEVLLLWDRVIGLDSLLPLAVLAVAVVCFRRQVVLSCHSMGELMEVMGDLSQLQTVPLLQAVLFQG